METNYETNVAKKKNRVGKWMRNLIIFLVLALSVFIYIKFFFVFGTGVKSGELNYVVHKGYVFKTYEGKLIQAGFRAPRTGVSTGVQSYEFEFSIADKAVAERLMAAGGSYVELHYREYFGAVPWRGYSKYVVDSIIAIDRKIGNAPNPQAAE